MKPGLQQTAIHCPPDAFDSFLGCGKITTYANVDHWILPQETQPGNAIKGRQHHILIQPMEL